MKLSTLLVSTAIVVAVFVVSHLYDTLISSKEARDERCNNLQYIYEEY